MPHQTCFIRVFIVTTLLHKMTDGSDFHSWQKLQSQVAHFTLVLAMLPDKSITLNVGINLKWKNA